MERVTHFRSSGAKFFRRQSGTAVTGYIAIALLLVSAALPGLAQAAVYIGGSPKTTIVAHSSYYFKPWLSAPANDKVKFSISGKPYWASFDVNSGTLTGAVYAGNIGNYGGIRISATDGSSSSSMPVFSIAVTAAATTPPSSPPTNPTPPTNPRPPTNPTPTAATLQLSAPSYTVAQTAGSLTVKVNRTAGSAGAVSAVYGTANGSAVAGTDYTAVSGTLQWASGETATKSFTVPVKDSVPFTGSKTFMVALSKPSTGATVGTPASASVAIAGAAAPTNPGTGAGAPSAVSNLQLVNQGGPNVGANPPKTVGNVQTISWTAATAGAKAISYYRIYRNGAAYATTTALTYTDSNAPGSVDSAYDTAATAYTYDVTAVDTAGTEGPKAANLVAWSYKSGASNWDNYDLSWGSITENYNATGGGTKSISVLYVAGGFQPTVHPPQAPIDNLEIGGFKYFTIDVNPGSVANYNFLSFGTVSRLPPGDVFGWHPQVNVFDYGPAPKANTWATYKVPLTAIAMGSCQITASITGNKMTVTSIVSGEPLVDAGGFVTGPGVPAGTYVTAFAQNNAIGTFTLAGPGISSSTRVASEKMTFQRTSLYKFSLFPDVGNTTIYFNNLGFTTK
jgi:hypothetical protein